MEVGTHNEKEKQLETEETGMKKVLEWLR